MYILIEIDSLIQYILTTFSLSQLFLAYHHPTLPSPGSIYQKSQRHTWSHCKNPTKTIKLTTITRMQRTWSRPMLAGCLLLQCLCAYVRLLSWFTGSCSPGVLHISDSYNLSSPSSSGFLIHVGTVSVEISNLDSLHSVWIWVSAPLAYAAEGNLSDDDWTSHLS